MKNPPIAGKRLFLLDMDGTIYLDETLFDGTLDFLLRRTTTHSLCVRSGPGRARAQPSPQGFPELRL